jgi:hypothetical protein
MTTARWRLIKGEKLQCISVDAERDLEGKSGRKAHFGMCKRNQAHPGKVGPTLKWAAFFDMTSGLLYRVGLCTIISSTMRQMTYKNHFDSNVLAAC